MRNLVSRVVSKSGKRKSVSNNTSWWRRRHYSMFGP